MDLSADELKAAFGLRLREARHAAGLSQYQLAQAAGLHWSYISSVERGQRNISLLNIRRLAHALGIQPGDLV
ncbi:helix-turn-helix domain-containing protein [Jiangella alba]|uniref:Helix-turn-helix domain-containing protein n=1 Tax=Jiangella alba TaxID=561176 RepID=A0A1H5PJD8_9ACTN|nr:helix-turn-helix transcriptional regulator [Jiangella alba]SEF13826.1 Helix-turn-helix domain-containing protein [Jiangella alba]